LQSHSTIKSWIEVEKLKAQNQQILDYIWVYTYKFNQDGTFKSCKARLVVRGDQQKPTSQKTYATTLATRSFRIVMAIAARFNLELKQYDAINAFVNAQLEDTVEITAQMPCSYSTLGCCSLVDLLPGVLSTALW